MEGKNSFLLYADIMHTVCKLPDDVAGRLFKHILEYVNDMEPVTEELLVQVTAEPIIQSLKRDLKKWNKEKEGKKQGAKVGNLKRWHPDLYEKYKSEELSLDECLKIASSRKVSHTDSIPTDTEQEQSHPIASVAVSDSVNVSDSVSVKETLLSEMFIPDEKNPKTLNPQIEIPEKDKEAAMIAFRFWTMIKKNLERYEISTVKIEKSKYKNWVPPVRLMIANKEVTIEQLRQLYEYLEKGKDKFWQTNIMSTEKLREQAQQVLLKINTQKDGQNTTNQQNNGKGGKRTQEHQEPKKNFATPSD